MDALFDRWAAIVFSAAGLPNSVRWQAARCSGPRAVKVGPLGKAAVERERTARVEQAAGRQVERTRQFAARRGDAGAPRRVEFGRRIEQRLRIGMARRGEQRLGRADLDHLAEIHHRDAMRDVADQAQIVRDEHHGQLQPLLQLQQQVDDLRLHRDIERRDQLVGDQHLGLDRKRPRDADALALAAGKLVRVALGGIGRQAHEREQLGDARRDLAPAAASRGRAAPRDSTWRTVMRGLSEL